MISVSTGQSNERTVRGGLEISSFLFTLSHFTVLRFDWSVKSRGGQGEGVREKRRQE